MTKLRLVALLAVVLVVGMGATLAPRYVTAAAFIGRVGRIGGTLGTWSAGRAETVLVEAGAMIPTRHGAVATRTYRPSTGSRRTVLLIPGIHSMGIEEPRLTGLARDLASAGVRVVTMALPDLQRYRITPAATDVIEDAASWITRQPSLAEDGRVGLVGISFAGGLSIAAATRPALADRVAFVVSFGGHGDLPRVMRYLTTGEAPRVDGFVPKRPHDYGVAVILYGLADQGVVPAEQVNPLRDGIRTFLLASQLTLVDRDRAERTFAEARVMAAALPEPARTYMGYVNDRDVARLGPVLVPFLDRLGTGDPALSPARAAAAPGCPVFLLHGQDDTVIPAVETRLLGAALTEHGGRARVLLSPLITHAELNESINPRDAWDLIAFWADVFAR